MGGLALWKPHIRQIRMAARKYFYMFGIRRASGMKGSPGTMVCTYIGHLICELVFDVEFWGLPLIILLEFNWINFYQPTGIIYVHVQKSSIISYKTYYNI